MEMEKVAAFRQYLELRGLALVTVQRHCYTLQRYSIWCTEQGYNPAGACEGDLLEYLSKLRAEKMRPTSLQQTFSSLSVYFAWLARQNKVLVNPVPEIKEFYLKSYKNEVRQRQLISIEDAGKMISATMNARDKAILFLLFKTGIRRNELVSLDVADVDLQKMEIELKPTGKRSNRIVFFDEEAARALRRWLKIHESRKPTGMALFLNEKNGRLGPNGVDNRVAEAAIRAGLHDPASEKLEDKFGPHCCRHWFTTHLRRAGMPREFIQELRGDARRDAIDIYDHIDKEELRKSYLAHVPQLGV
jgi:integrase/recombinase XerD